MSLRVEVLGQRRAVNAQAFSYCVISVLRDGLAISGTVDGTLILWSVADQGLVGNLSDPVLSRRHKRETTFGGIAHKGKVCTLSGRLN